MVEELYREQLPASAKIGYGIANGANGILSGLGLGQIMYLYSAIFGMDPVLQGWVWILFAGWNAVNDPILGILEERIDTKIGRRIPVLRYGAPLYAVLFVFVWFPFAPYGNQTLLFLNLFIVLFVFDTVYSMIGLVTYSLPAEMAITAEERGSIVTYSTFLGIGSQVLGIVLPLVFLGDENLDFRIWQLLMIVIAGLSCAALIGSSYLITENQWARKEPTLGFIESIKETFKNKQFLVLEVSIFMLVMTQNILTGGILFLFDYAIPMSGLEFLYFGPGVITLVIFILIFNKLIHKHGIKKLFMIGSVIGGFGLVLLPFGGRNLPVLSGILCLILIGFAAIIIGQQPLMADVIDYDEMLTGKRRETTYSGINALITKPAISIANSLFLAILSLFGYNPDLDKASQPDSVGDGVLLAFALIPGICIAVSTISLFFFKLDGPEWLRKKQDLARIHAEKEMELIEKLRREGKI